MGRVTQKCQGETLRAEPGKRRQADRYRGRGLRQTQTLSDSREAWWRKGWAVRCR